MIENKNKQIATSFLLVRTNPLCDIISWKKVLLRSIRNEWSKKWSC